MNFHQNVRGEDELNEIAIGDTVRLSTGGPEMIVTELNDHNVIASITSVSKCALPRACVTLIRKAKQ